MDWPAIAVAGQATAILGMAGVIAKLGLELKRAYERVNQVQERRVAEAQASGAAVMIIAEKTAALLDRRGEP